MADERDNSFPQRWLFETLTRIEAQQTRHASELRADISNLRGELQAVRTLQTSHELADSEVEGRVKTLEAKDLERSSLRRVVETATISAVVIAVGAWFKSLLR